MTRTSSSPNFSEYRTVGEAAQFLGVSTATLRNWDRAGKLKPRRHPQNGYRIYLHDDLEAVLRSVDSATLTEDSFAPLVDWNDMGESEHFVQFYESDEYLIDSVSGFVGAALTAGHGSIVIATPEHRYAIERKLTAVGVDLAASAAAGHWAALDAAETLAKFMIDGSPDPDRFNEVVGAVVARLAHGDRRLHAFGEMVALLWAGGHRDAAIQLEELWNDLGRQHRFALFCAYPLAGFDGADHEARFNGICSCHTRVLPADSYAAIESPADRLRAITLLQQKAQSLEAEIAHRSQIEKSLVQAERGLREADRRKDEFLATLAHELRNPLAPIKNALEILRNDGLNQELVAEARNIMDRQVAQVARLVDDLLDVSRITRDKIELRQERVALTDIIASAVETSRPLIDAAGHALVIDAPAEPVMVEADPARLAQVFSNLLNNSAKYTEPGGKISLRAERVGDEVVVSVVDNGVGISREALAYVFDMFRQVDHSFERAQGGLGIGLTLVRQLVELHGGAVTAASAGPGQGSEFTVRLPAAAGDERRPQAPPAKTKTAVTKRRILVVDDNRDSGDTLSKLLRMKGHEVRAARDGLEAIDATGEFRPDVILMDVGMPRLNGYDATRRIRQLPGGEDVFIVALTGWGQENDHQRSADAGCSAHLVKPVDFGELDRLLASHAQSAPLS